MGTYKNALCGGREQMRAGDKLISVEGEMIKHPALINKYASPAKQIGRDKPLRLIGLDIETDHTCGKPALLGQWRNERYTPYYAGKIPLFHALVSVIRQAHFDGAALASWRKFDGYALIRILLEQLNPTIDEAREICKRLDKIEGKAGKEPLSWNVAPPILVEFLEGRPERRVQIGVMKVIRSSIQFFIWREDFDRPFTIWLYDASQFYQKGLEAEATSRYEWYSKVDDSAHIVDWLRFEQDSNYHNDTVLKSNMLDARAAAALGRNIQDEFYNILGVYPNSLISTGALARLAARKMIADSGDTDGYESLSIRAQLEEWGKRGIDETLLLQLYHLACAGYSGGMIDALVLGFVQRAALADISAAYPSEIVKLRDLRSSIVVTGEGDPPEQTDTRYVFVEGTVHVPSEKAIIHTITIRDGVHKQVNQRPEGTFRATYTEHERSFALAQGVTFTNETWVGIECQDRPSPLAQTCRRLVDLRAELTERGDSGAYAAKIASLSLYGITYEAVPLFSEDERGALLHDGYRAGELFNPILASIITSETRIKLATGALEIQKRGGIPMIFMTDCVIWTVEEGASDDALLAMLPADMWRPTKVLGYFEQPAIVRDLVCIAPGRYEYRKGDKLVMKTLGFTIERAYDGTTLRNEYSFDPSPTDDEITDTHKQGRYGNSWRELLMRADPDDEDIAVPVRRLVSPGLVAQGQHSYKELCYISEYKEYVSLRPQLSKRSVNRHITARRLLAGLTPTSKPNAQETGHTPDGTLPVLWKHIKDKPLFITEEQREQRRKRNRNKSAKQQWKEREQKQRQQFSDALLAHSLYLRERDRSPYQWEQRRQQNLQQFEEQRRAYNRAKVERHRARQQEQITQMSEEERAQIVERRREYERERKRQQRTQKREVGS